MTRKNTKSVAFTTVMALLVILAVGFGEASAEIFDVGEWQMTSLELSEMYETYAGTIAIEGQLENAVDRGDATYTESVAAEIAYMGAFQEVIRSQ